MTDRTVEVEQPFECVPHWIIFDSGLSANAIKVYLTLRKFRDYDSGECWPSRKRLASLAGVSLSTLDRALSDLAAADAICVTHRKTEYDESRGVGGGQTSNMYHVHWERGCSKALVTDDETPSSQVSRGGSSKVVHEQRPIDEQDPRNKEHTIIDPIFDDFWTAYPRKIGKGQARRAFKTALRKTTAETLISAVVEFRQWCETEQTEPQFIPHPSTWLNGERWTDERVSSHKPSNTQAHLALVRQLAAEDGYLQSRAELEAGD